MKALFFFSTALKKEVATYDIIQLQKNRFHEWVLGGRGGGRGKGPHLIWFCIHDIILTSYGRFKCVSDLCLKYSKSCFHS